MFAYVMIEMMKPEKHMFKHIFLINISSLSFTVKKSKGGCATHITRPIMYWLLIIVRARAKNLLFFVEIIVILEFDRIFEGFNILENSVIRSGCGKMTHLGLLQKLNKAAPAVHFM